MSARPKMRIRPTMRVRRKTRVRRRRCRRKHFDDDPFEVAKVAIHEILAARQLDVSLAARAGLFHNGAQGDEVAEVERRADIFHETFYPF
jgi:hypothetical protein